ncbi:MAG: radical SAM protein [Holophagales bacterium]|nr:radical SAM protein [Holophagales bacterium]
MRVLMISANRERDPSPVFPLGLAYLAAAIEKAGHAARLLDLCFAGDVGAEVCRALDETVPGVVLVSIRNLDNVTWPSSRSYVDGVREVVALCRDRAVVVLGGSGFSLEPVSLLAATGAHCGVVGEGEEVLPYLIERIEAGVPLQGLPGVVVAGDGKPARARIPASVGTPSRRLFDVSRYLTEGGAANVQTKRGCPFGCVYCTYPILEGSRVRTRPAADVVRELRGLVDEHGVDYVEFCDDIFNFPEAAARELCEAMIADGLRLSWSAFVNPGHLDARLLDLMVRAGCDAVELGTDSGSPAMLRSLGKSFTVEEVRRSSRFCRDAGVATAHYLLFGGPGENDGTIAESVALMDELAPDAVIVMIGIRIYAGTGLYEVALREGVVSEGQSLLEPVFYPAEPELRRIAERVAQEAGRRRTWIVPGLDVNTSTRVLEMLRRRQQRGPVWKVLGQRATWRGRTRQAAEAGAGSLPGQGRVPLS